VRERGEDHLEALERVRCWNRAGCTRWRCRRCRTRRRPSMPNGLPGVSLTRRMASASPGASRVDDHARALGREVAGPEAGAAGRHDDSGEAGHQVAEREREPRRCRRRSPGGSITAQPASLRRATTFGPARSSRVPSCTPSETTSTFATSCTCTIGRRRHAVRVRPAFGLRGEDGAGRGRGVGSAEDRATATRMSTPAAAASPRCRR